MPHTIKILAFAGSTRRQSLNKLLSAAAATAAATHGASVTWIDLADYPIALYDGDLEEANGLPAPVLRLRQLFQEHDALIIASPEYNGYFPPLIKNVFDWLSRPLGSEERHAVFRHLSVLPLAAVRGSSGGTRGLQQLSQLLGNLKAEPFGEEFVLPKAHEAFDEQGTLREATLRLRLDKLVAVFVEHVRSAQALAA